MDLGSLNSDGASAPTPPHPKEYVGMDIKPIQTKNLFITFDSRAYGTWVEIKSRKSGSASFSCVDDDAWYIRKGLARLLTLHPNLTSSDLSIHRSYLYGHKEMRELEDNAIERAHDAMQRTYGWANPAEVKDACSDWEDEYYEKFHQFRRNYMEVNVFKTRGF